MEILSSGLFINTENQEKIEQLKFTAIELANAALGTTGFVNEEEAGKKFALDFWQGLEYMCREAEEAAIKNIFLNHFLERLGESHTTENTNEQFANGEDSSRAATEKKIETAAENSKNENSEITERQAMIKIEGQEFEIEADLVQDDKLLKTILQPHFANVENANITRDVKEGKLIVTIIKKAQHKGS